MMIECSALNILNSNVFSKFIEFTAFHTKYRKYFENLIFSGLMGLVPGAMGLMAMEYTAPHSMDLMPMEGSIQEGRAVDR